MSLTFSAVARRFVFTLGMIALMPGIAAESNAAPAHYCEVVMDLTIDGRLVGSPSAIVEFGKQAEITLRDAGGVHGWQLTIVVDEPSVVRRALAMPAQMQLFELDGDESVLRAEPHIAVVPGQHATLEMPLAGTDGRRAKLGFTAQIRTEAEVKARLDAAMNQSN